MKSQTLWTKLTELVTSLLSDLDQSDADAVLSAWNSKKNDVMSLLPTTTRRKKDKDAPTRPLASYIFYCNKNRQKVVEKNKGIDAKDVMRMLGKQWKALSDKEKKPYEAEAKKDRERYKREMASYVPAEQPEVEEKKTRKKADPNQPKRVISAYLFFSKDARATVKEKFPELKGKDVLSKIGEMWHALSDEEKKPYEALSAQDRVRYNTEKGVEAKVSSRKKTQESKVKPATKPATKRATKVTQTEGWKRFYEEQKEEHSDWTERKLKMTVNKQWREMSEEQREQYEHPVDNEEEAEEEAEDDDDFELSDEDGEELATE